MTDLNHLIGLPWGFGDGQTDCVRLAIAAQDVLGHNIPLRWEYTPENFEQRTKDIQNELEKISHKIASPETGAVILFNFSPYYHLGTLINTTHFLHIPRGGTSRLTRWSVPYQKITVGIYKISDDYIRNPEVRTW